MPKLPPKPCTHPMCTKYATNGSRCEEHRIKPWDHGGKTRHERGYGSNWDKIRKVALTRDNNLCQSCLRDGIYTLATQVDHVKPKSMGGTDHLDNLESICTPCHKIKTSKESSQAKRKRRDGLLD